jgi:hypothetical protein
MLAQGRSWRAKLNKNADGVWLEIPKSRIADDNPELWGLKIEVPLGKWSLVIKNVQSDRKLLGGVLLDFAKDKNRVSAAVGNDRLFSELQRVILDATVALVEAGSLTLTQPEALAE